MKKMLNFLKQPFYFILARIKLREVSGLHEEFTKSKRIDIFPLSGGGRGFMIIVDNKKALYFYQDGDHFSYDGCEIGEYDNGNVTIFDNIEKL